MPFKHHIFSKVIVKKQLLTGLFRELVFDQSNGQCTFMLFIQCLICAQFNNQSTEFDWSSPVAN